MSERPFLFLIACLVGTPAFAACPQEKAIYGDSDSAYELRFEPVGSEAAAASNHFKLVVLSSPITLDGVVMRSDDPARSDGILMFHCPQGDVTGADLRACTIWQGPIYAAGADGVIDVLPAEGAEAAQRVLLSSLGPAIRQSSIWGKGKAHVAPWDVLTFKGCSR